MSDARPQAVAATPLIQIEHTPNPEALRILPGVTWLSGAPIELVTGDDASEVPLAVQLLKTDGIASVLIGPNLVPSSDLHRTTTGRRSSRFWSWWWLILSDRAILLP